MVAVPRRKIDGKFQSLRLARLGKFPHNIALAALPRGVFYGIIGKFRRPHTKSAMVFGGENNALHTRLTAHLSPLSAVEVRGVEKLETFVAKSPLLVGVSI